MTIQTLEQMQEIVKVALAAVNLAEVALTLEDDHLSVAGGVVSISPVVVDVKSITGKRKMDGWEVVWWKQTAGGPGYLDPPDYDDKELYAGPNAYEAAKIAVMALHQDRLDNALEYYGEQLEP